MVISVRRRSDISIIYYLQLQIRADENSRNIILYCNVQTGIDAYRFHAIRFAYTDDDGSAPPKLLLYSLCDLILHKFPA